MKLSESLSVRTFTLEDLMNYQKLNNELVSSSSREKKSYQDRNSYNKKKTMTPVQNNKPAANFNFATSNVNEIKNNKNKTIKQSMLNIGKETIGNNYYNIEITNFSELVNKVVYDGMSGNKSANLVTNNSNTTNMLTILNEYINKNSLRRSNSISIPSFVTDLVTFFNDNNLNLQNFCDFFNHLFTFYLKDEKIKNTRFNFLIARVNRTHTVARVPVTNYETILYPRIYFFILEGDEKALRGFTEDRRFIMETLFKAPDDFVPFDLFVNKKISELHDHIEKLQRNEGNIKNMNNNNNDPFNILLNFNKLDEAKDMKSLLQNINITNDNFIYKCKAVRKLPEGLQHGLFLIYKEGFIEFRPVTNNYKGSFLKIQCSKVKALISYRYLYKNRGINIFLYQSTRSKILIFESEKDYNEVFNILSEKCFNIDKTYLDIKYHTNLWVNGLMSNYDYLLYINTMASRTFNDLSQYPVFPWIISNYDEEEEFDIGEAKNYRDLSRPIGALNPEKFETFYKNFKNRTNSMNEPPYLYNSHYSTPAIVIYYLTRALPQYQLHLQGGSFGPPERMFNNVSEFWGYIYAHGREVNELVPEFYNSDGEFMVNVHNIPLAKSNGKYIDNITLPKWARTPKDFIHICRAALESEYVSSNINQWIDLIFGYKQKGEEAEAADNLFNYVAYDNFEYEADNDLRTQAYITEIQECGQVPKQLFIEPHPKKKTTNLLDYQLLTNPQEEMKIKIENLKKENQRLEKNYKKIEIEKNLEKENLIKEYKENEKKKLAKISQLKE
jgi:hypothetical protein